MPEELTFEIARASDLAAAKSLHAKAVNHVWLGIASISVGVIAVDSSSGVVTFLGFGLSPPKFFLSAFIMQWFGILVLCNKHAMTQVAGKAFESYLSEKFGDAKLAANLSYRRFFYLLYEGDLVRASPFKEILINYLGRGMADSYYRVSGMVSVSIFFLIPLIGIFFSLFRAELNFVLSGVLLLSLLVPVGMTCLSVWSVARLWYGRELESD